MQSYKRNQIEEAFSGMYEPGARAPSVGLKTKLKRLLETDRDNSLTIAGTKVTAVDITADLTALQSDDNQRDNQLRNNGLQTNQFPTATFTIRTNARISDIPSRKYISREAVFF